MISILIIDPLIDYIPLLSLKILFLIILRFIEKKKKKLKMMKTASAKRTLLGNTKENSSATLIDLSNNKRKITFLNVVKLSEADRQLNLHLPAFDSQNLYSICFFQRKKPWELKFLKKKKNAETVKNFRLTDDNLEGKIK